MIGSSGVLFILFTTAGQIIGVHGLIRLILKKILQVKIEGQGMYSLMQQALSWTVRAMKSSLSPYVRDSA